jgi:hypothetical protein
MCGTMLIYTEFELDSQHSDAGDRRKPNLAIVLKVRLNPFNNLISRTNTP